MLKNYLIIALKVLNRRRFFTFISLFAVSFTLVMLIMATSLLDHVFGPQPPESRLDRTLGVYTMMISGPEQRSSGEPGYGFLNKYVRTLPDVELVSIFSEAKSVATYLKNEKLKLWVKQTDGNYWRILDFEFIEGSPFSEEDDHSGNRVAVVNASTAHKFFGAPSALGKSIDADGQSFRVVGVVRDVPSLRFTPFADIWVPIGTAQNDVYKSQLMGGFQAMILARDKSDFPRIKADFAANLERVDFSNMGVYNRMAGAPETFFESLSREAFSSGMQESHPVVLLSLIVGLMVMFMMLPTINLININVSRILERASEIGVRKAFGASSISLIGQFVIENLILTLIGGAIALVVSAIGLQVLSSSGFVPYAEFHINFRILGYSLLITTIFGLFAGVYPAWRMSRMHPVEALRGKVQ
ncbi:MAG: ABC transporter permease [Candidatus Zixiibacteriota bacterium]